MLSVYIFVALFFCAICSTVSFQCKQTAFGRRSLLAPRMAAKDAQGYEIKTRDWFSGLSRDPGGTITDPRAVPPEAKQFVEDIKNGKVQTTYKGTIEILDRNYDYFEVPFTCGENSNPPKVNTGAAKILSFGLLTKLTKEQTLTLFGEYYRELTPTGTDHPNIRNFIKYGWDGVKFDTGLAIISKLQAYEDTDAAMATQSTIAGEMGWDADSDSWIP